MGKGEYQIKLARSARQKILALLRDGEWHRYSELKQKTALSTATLSKHLKELERGIIERQIDITSKEYPPPVSYRLKLDVLNLNRFTYEALMIPVKRFETIDLSEPKDGASRVALLMEYVNLQTALGIFNGFRNYFENKDETQLQQSIDFYLSYYYRDVVDRLREKLDDAAAKGVDVKMLLLEADKEILKRYKL
ncbi:MAG: winged helix-turn-helix transcriptional regulator [Candidatus Bathyarchaeia archaeon]